MRDTVLVIPCYNEADRLDVDAYRTYAARTPGLRFLFVDDGSTDGTAEVLEALCGNGPAFDAMGLAHNQGKAEAVRRGILKALESEPAFVGFWDADLSTPLAELDGFLEVFERHPAIEMVFGARVNLLGRTIRRNLTRHYIGRIFATMAATALKLPIYDTQCGAKVFRVDDALAELFREPFLSRWIFDVEIIARRLTGRRRSDGPPVRDVIYELPLTAWHDVQGSKIRLRDFVVVAGDFLRIHRAYLRRAR